MWIQISKILMESNLLWQLTKVVKCQLMVQMIFVCLVQYNSLILSLQTQFWFSWNENNLSYDTSVQKHTIMKAGLKSRKKKLIKIMSWSNLKEKVCWILMLFWPLLVFCKGQDNLNSTETFLSILTLRPFSHEMVTRTWNFCVNV